MTGTVFFRDFKVDSLLLPENPVRAKTEQKQIATGFVHNGLTPDSRLLQDSAFAYFAKVWRKHKSD